MLATNAVKSPGINWGSDPAAIDFFGPADETDSRGTRQHIIGTFLIVGSPLHGLFHLRNADAYKPPTNAGW